MNPAKDVFSCQRDVNQRAKPAATLRLAWAADSASLRVDATGRNGSRPHRTQEVAGSSPASSIPRTPANAGVRCLGRLPTNRPCYHGATKAAR